MQRRALLASGALLATAGCLTDVRRRLSGPVRHDHSRATVHRVAEPFVPEPWSNARGVRAWLFPTAPPAGTNVFSDALGAETKREWNNEIHNENYADGFLLLLQTRRPKTDARMAAPAVPVDPHWNRWNQVQIPFELQRRDVDYPNSSGDIVCTFLGVYTTATSPTHAKLTLYEEGEGAALGPRLTTVEARRWEPR